ncbi:DUF6302 family protein [Streptomyces sp. PA5.6]|uniref:DUF6302 family protein n=1 Tax=Streptomyces sp. PA5.6 TaxID=3035651 RepID=UPI003904699F
MHNPTAPAHPPVRALILPPYEACDFVYYEQRLADPYLLDQALAVRTLRMAFLAVPVGGARRGGFYAVECVCFGLAVRDALRGLPGFPDVRLRWSPWPDTAHNVEWGERPPWLWGCHDDAVLGRFYGYSEAAINRYTTARTRAAHSPLPEASDPLPYRSVDTAPGRALPAAHDGKDWHA